MEAKSTTTKSKAKATKKKAKKYVSYNPKKVVKLATKKVKKLGKVYIPDDLKAKLKDGRITKEEYKEYYPTDGVGWMAIYVDTNLKQARSVSGTRLKSENAIANYIARIYSTFPQEKFYIEYHGKEKYGSKKCYVFYCYR